MDTEVIIVGAGAAGLYAGYLLKHLGISAQILEAAADIGGRTVHRDGFAPFSLDIGAEFLHGEAGVVMDLCKKHGWKFTELYNFYGSNMMREGVYVEGVLKSWQTNDDAKLVGVRHVAEIIEECEPEIDVRLDEFVRENGVSDDRYYQLAENFIAKTFATELNKLGVIEFAREERDWPFGRKNYRLEEGFKVVTRHLSQGLTIRTNEPVLKIDYRTTRDGKDTDRVLVHTATGKTLSAKYVIVTVPLPVLRDGDIKFVPSLPYSKQQALQKIGWGTGMKLVLSFKEEFYADRREMLIITDHPIIAQFWFHGSSTRSSPVKPLPNGAVCTATAFIMGESVEVAQKIGQDHLVAEFMKLLEGAYPGKNIKSLHVGTLSYDWGSNQYVRGAYSSPAYESAGARRIASEPLSGRLYFGGEALNTASSATVLAAMQTGARTVAEICMHKLCRLPGSL